MLNSCCSPSNSPWGWYANPIGATCSTAWAVMHDHDFNPFLLGGGYTSALPSPSDSQRATIHATYDRLVAEGKICPGPTC